MLHRNSFLFLSGFKIKLTQYHLSYLNLAVCEAFYKTFVYILQIKLPPSDTDCQFNLYTDERFRLISEQN